MAMRACTRLIPWIAIVVLASPALAADGVEPQRQIDRVQLREVPWADIMLRVP
jgi:hypothetical protein